MTQNPTPKKKIKVEIIATERVHYHQIIEMPEELFKQLDAMLDEDEEMATDKIMEWVDRADVTDDDSPEVNDFRRYKEKP